MAVNETESRARHPSVDALALYEELRERLYRVSEGHPAYPHLREAAVAAYCHWRALSYPPLEAGLVATMCVAAE